MHAPRCGHICLDLFWYCSVSMYSCMVYLLIKQFLHWEDICIKKLVKHYIAFYLQWLSLLVYELKYLCTWALENPNSSWKYWNIWSPPMVGEGNLLVSLEQSVAVFLPHFIAKQGFGHLNKVLKLFQIWLKTLEKAKHHFLCQILLTWRL